MNIQDIETLVEFFQKWRATKQAKNQKQNFVEVQKTAIFLVVWTTIEQTK